MMSGGGVAPSPTSYTAFLLTIYLRVLVSDIHAVRQIKATECCAGEHVMISIRLVVERPGVYAVQAKIPQQSAQEAAALFTATLQKAEQDLKQILGLQ